MSSMREGMRPGITFQSSDGTTIVSPDGDGRGGIREGAWVVWDMTAPRETRLFDGVVFKSKEAAMGAASAARESAITWAAMSIAGRLDRVSTFIRGLAAGIAVRLGS